MARIVIVKDETQVRMPAESVLQQAGHDMLSAATVAEAQAIINYRGGLTFGKLVAETRKGTPVLFTSGRTLTDGMQSLFVDRRAFLPKHFTARLLTEAVTELIRAG